VRHAEEMFKEETQGECKSGLKNEINHSISNHVLYRSKMQKLLEASVEGTYT
jgi:hypothetical protein